MQSIYQNLGGTIEMPEFKGRKLYMHKTSMNRVELPQEFKDFTEQVEGILDKVQELNHVCYITIDEKRIQSETHRRSGIHVDFNWFENGHGGSPKPQHVGGIDRNGKWGSPYWNKSEHGGMLLVSNYAACQVWRGEFDGEIGDGGDCSGIDVTDLDTEVMPSGEVYYLNATGIHESLFVPGTVNRTLIRINFHPEYVFDLQ